MIARTTNAATSRATKRRRTKAGVVYLAQAKQREPFAQRAPRLWFYLLNFEGSTDADRGQQALEALYAYHEARKVELPPIEAIAIEAADRELQRLIERPQAQAMLRCLRKGDHVVCQLRHLGRSRKDWLEAIKLLQQRGLVLHIVEPGRETFEVAGRLEPDIAERLAAMIDDVADKTARERIRKTMKRLDAQGRAISSRPRLGFKRIETKRGPKWVSSWTERRWLNRVLEWQRQGWTIDQIYRALRYREAKTGSGERWTRRRLERSLQVLRERKPEWVRFPHGADS